MAVPSPSAASMSTRSAVRSAASAASTNTSATGALPVTANGMTIIGGSLPDSSERNARRCVRIGCKSTGAQKCVRRYCKSCCQGYPLQDGLRCSVHKGTTPQRLPRNTGVPAVFTPDEDDPLDVNVTYSRNLQREWQDVWAETESRASADINYRTTGQRLIRTESHCTVVWVWYKDGERPKPLYVTAPSWPFIHPNELPAIASQVIKNGVYWYYEEAFHAWIQTNRPFRIDSGQILYTRASNVTICPGQPGPDNIPSILSTPTKRLFTHTGFTGDSPSPSKFSRTSSSSRVDDSVTAPSSPSISQTSTLPLPGIGLSPMRLLNLMSGSPSRSISRSSSDIPSPLSQRIVQDFPTLDLGVDPENPFIEVSDNTPSTGQAASGIAASIPLTSETRSQSSNPVHNASAMTGTCASLESPSAPSNSGLSISSAAGSLESSSPLTPPHNTYWLSIDSNSPFPLTFVCDMLPRMRLVVDDDPGMDEIVFPPDFVQDDMNLNIPQRFVKVFARPFKHGTFYDARKVYRGVPKAIRDDFASKGRTLEGRWSEMVKWWQHNK